MTVVEKRYALRTDVYAEAVIDMLGDRLNHAVDIHETWPCDQTVEAIGTALDGLADAAAREQWLVARLTEAVAIIAVNDKKYHHVVADEIISDATDIACVNYNYVVSHGIDIAE